MYQIKVKLIKLRKIEKAEMKQNLVIRAEVGKRLMKPVSLNLLFLRKLVR